MAIAWNEQVPSISSTVGTFPPYGRSVWTAIANGMLVEHFWDGETGSASSASRGELKPGASRAYVDTASRASAPDSQSTGRLFFVSDTSRLLAYGSNGTYLAGTPYCSVHSSIPANAYWRRQTGSYSFAMSGGGPASGSTTITFPVPYLAPPTVKQTGSPDILTFGTPYLMTDSISAATATSRWSFFGGATAPLSRVTVYWESFGTVSTQSY